MKRAVKTKPDWAPFDKLPDYIGRSEDVVRSMYANGVLDFAQGHIGLKPMFDLRAIDAKMAELQAYAEPLPTIAPAFSLTGLWLLEMRQPMVYVWRRGDEVLYVGMACNGLARPLNPRHHRLASVAILPTDTLGIHPCRSALHAEILERDLILALKPTLNRTWQEQGIRRSRKVQA